VARHGFYSLKGPLQQAASFLFPISSSFIALCQNDWPLCARRFAASRERSLRTNEPRLKPCLKSFLHGALQLHNGLPCPLGHFGVRIRQQSAQWLNGTAIAQGAQRHGCVRTDPRIRIAQRGDQGIDGAAITQGAQNSDCLPTDGCTLVVEGGEQIRDGLPMIHLHQRSQREQAETRALVGEQRSQRGDRSRIAQSTQGLDGGFAHLILRIGKQGEQGGKCLPSLVAAAHDVGNCPPAHLAVWISQSSKQGRERDGGCLHGLLSAPCFQTVSLTLFFPTAPFSASKEDHRGIRLSFLGCCDRLGLTGP